MGNPLDGCWARHRRAVMHYKVMEAELAVLADEAKAVSFRSEFNSETNEAIIYIDGIPNFPSSWGLIASEAFFNARVALDYLAWELARWNLEEQGKAGDPHGRTQFPIATNPKSFQQQQESKRDLHPAHRAEIERLQPYGDETLAKFMPGQVRSDNREDLAKTSPLAKLMLISNQDKHRVLRPIGSGIQSASVGDPLLVDCEIVSAGHLLPSHVNKDAQWSVYRLRPTGPNPAVKVRDWVVPDVAFGDFNFLAEFPGVVRAVSGAIRRFMHVFGAPTESL